MDGVDDLVGVLLFVDVRVRVPVLLDDCASAPPAAASSATATASATATSAAAPVLLLTW